MEKMPVNTTCALNSGPNQLFFKLLLFGKQCIVLSMLSASKVLYVIFQKTESYQQICVKMLCHCRGSLIGRLKKQLVSIQGTDSILDSSVVHVLRG
jgi:hypothetical protein